MAKPNKANNDFAANPVSKRSFGNKLMLKNETKKFGSNYGSKKAIQSGNYQIFPAIVKLNLNASRIIGYVKFQNKTLISAGTNIYFSTALTFTKEAA